MTEHMSSPEENTPEATAPRRIDKLVEPAWQEFLAHAERIEHTLHAYPPNNKSGYIAAEQHIPQLDQMISGGNETPRCQVVGFGYTEDMPGVESDQLIFVNTDAAVYTGVDIMMIDDQWRVIIAIQTVEGTDQLPDGLYYFAVTTGDLTRLDFYVDPLAIDNEAPEKKPIVDLHTKLIQHAAVSRDVITDDDFLSQIPDEQRRILISMTQRVAADIMPEYKDCIVTIDCKDYYTAYDDMPGVELSDSYTNISILPEDEQYNLVGTIIDISYPELDALPPEQPIDLAVLKLNQGAPCVVVYNEVLRKHYYIPSQHIASII